MATSMILSQLQKERLNKLGEAAKNANQLTASIQAAQGGQAAGGQNNLSGVSSGAYTYEDFVEAAKAVGVNFSDADIRLAQSNPSAGMSILKYKTDWKNATTAEAKELANAGAEKIRAEYGGYSGSGDGGSYTLTGSAPRPTYESQNGDKIQQLLDAVSNPGEFSYDPKTDPSYASYKKEYAREGQRATADTMGAAAAMTGGIPSSYAATAAQQAGNYYAAQMADKVPELEQTAYSRWLDQFNQKRAALSDTLSAEQQDYGKYQDQLTQYNTDRSYNYQKDVYEQSQREKQEEKEKQEKDDEWNKAYTMAQLAAANGDYSLMQQLGINTSNSPDEFNKRLTIAQIQAQYGDYSGLRELGIMKSGESGGSSGGSGSGGSGGGSGSSNGSKTSSSGQSSEKGSEIAKYTTAAYSLGIGPVSESTLSGLVNSGKVELTNENGTPGARWAAGYNAQNYNSASAGRYWA